MLVECVSLQKQQHLSYTQAMIADQKARTRALDITQSFIVQAPAGSGKTELLTQRYLALLARSCQMPEEILAITFTRKAASEMRERVIKSLEKARQPKPEQTHAQETWQLANQVIARDQQLHWGLLQNPNRLRIQTIDSLCASLSRQLPILSRFGSQPAISEHPYSLYQQAVAEIFNQFDEPNEWNDALQQLLLHLDNRMDRIEYLLINMLSKRDQWLPMLHAAKTDNQLKTKIQKTLAIINAENINQLRTHFSKTQQENLLTLIRFAAANLMAEESNSPIRDGWQMDLAHPFIKADIHDQKTLENLKNFWLAVCELLLKKDDEFRKAPRASEGFPAPSKAKDKTTKAQLKLMKEQMLEFLDDCQARKGLLDNLVWFRLSPPLVYPEQDWQLVEALLLLLPVAAAQLQLIFQTHAQVDFTEISQAALLALGDENHPTDLAMSLDYRIQHILVDEFQDTSIAQAHLLEKLTHAWQPDDEKTLFVVGDPMQSIYRFRNAEVGLFLRAQQHGIGQINLQALQLTENFRSTKNIVDWVNQTFSKLFPQENNIALGAISHAESHAALPFSKQSNIQCLLAKDEAHEANLLIDLVKQHQHHGKTAILVQARSHLQSIIDMLKNHNIAYQAVEIDNLADKSIIQDLLALTKALIHPADSIAWLSILRAPWCGLTLKDLHIIANGRGNKTIWQQLQSHEIIKNLSSDGKIRALTSIDILQSALDNYERLPLADWIQNTWQALGGKRCLENSIDKENTNAYFEFLDQFTAHDLSQFDEFERRLYELFAKPNEQACNLQILTIHKSKGLEFDNVIIPALGNTKAPKKQALLSWLERPRETQGEDFLIAPINTMHSSDDKIFNYIKEQEKLREQYELMRLFYVATTRAKNNLYLLAHASFDDEKEKFIPNNNSLLKFIWHCLENQFIYESPVNQGEITQLPIKSFNLKRLNIEYFQKNEIHLSSNTIAHHKASDFIKQDDFYINLGIAMHKILQIISETTLFDVKKSKKNWRNLLLAYRIKPHQIENALSLLEKAVHNTLNDAHGQWIVSHQSQAKSEWALSQAQKDETTHLIIDRAFIDENNVYWIIDYKMIHDFDPNSPKAVEQVQKTYQTQLQSYADVLAELTNKPIKIGLYLPLQSTFINC